MSGLRQDYVYIQTEQAMVCGLRPGTPHEPHGTCPGTAPEFLSEYVIPAGITIAWGDDTLCARCECPLPAGAPAWPTGDGLNCADCTPGGAP